MQKAWNVAITIIALALIAAAPMVVKAPGSRVKAAPEQHADPPVAPAQHVDPPVAPVQHVDPPVAPAQHVDPPVAPAQHAEPPAPPQPAAARPVGIDVPITPPSILSSDRAKIENAWQDQLDGIWVQVFAGCIPGNQAQGVVWVVEEPPGGTKIHAYRTAEPAGCVRIVAADGTRLTLKATDGRSLIFDVATQEFGA
jgi:hypothetical protein